MVWPRPRSPGPRVGQHEPRAGGRHVGGHEDARDRAAKRNLVDEARAALAEYAGRVNEWLATFDELRHHVESSRPDSVITHGEPHPGNVIRVDESLLLIDWDTALLAPPERDLWMLASGERSVIDAYKRATARTVMSSMLDLYRLRWDVADIAIYIADFSGPHAKLNELGLVTEESSEIQYRFETIVDPATREPLFVIEHEVRCYTHPMFFRPLVNRNPAQRQATYQRGRDAFYPAG